MGMGREVVEGGRVFVEHKVGRVPQVVGGIKPCEQVGSVVVAAVEQAKVVEGYPVLRACLLADADADAGAVGSDVEGHVVSVVKTTAEVLARFGAGVGNQTQCRGVADVVAIMSRIVEDREQGHFATAGKEPRIRLLRALLTGGDGCVDGAVAVEGLRRQDVGATAQACERLAEGVGILKNFTVVILAVGCGIFVVAVDADEMVGRRAGPLPCVALLAVHDKILVLDVEGHVERTGKGGLGHRCLAVGTADDEPVGCTARCAGRCRRRDRGGPLEQTVCAVPPQHVGLAVGRGREDIGVGYARDGCELPSAPVLERLVEPAAVGLHREIVGKVGVSDVALNGVACAALADGERHGDFADVGLRGPGSAGVEPLLCSQIVEIEVALTAHSADGVALPCLCRRRGGRQDEQEQEDSQRRLKRTENWCSFRLHEVMIVFRCCFRCKVTQKPPFCRVRNVAQRGKKCCKSTFRQY